MGVFDKYLPAKEPSKGPSVFDKYLPKDPEALAPTLQERVGFDPDVKRLGLLPYPKGALKGDEGDIDWTDWVAPKAFTGMVEGAALPGHVLGGGRYTGEDVANLVGSWAVPGASKTNLPQHMKRSEFVRGAPTSEQLGKEAGKHFAKVDSSDVSVSGNAYADFLISLRDKLTNKGFDADGDLHPTVTSTLKSMEKQIDTELDVNKLKIIRAYVKDVAPDAQKAAEKRFGRTMVDDFDDFVIQNTPPEFAKTWSTARAATFASKRTEVIEKAIEKARDTASGFENGLRIEFRKILNSEKKMKQNKFSADEIEVMKQVVNGTLPNKILRYLGKFGLGTNRGLGSFLGGAAGAAAGGVPGAATALALGTAANAASGQMTKRAADLMLAMAAQGGKLPKLQGLINPMAVPYGAAAVTHGLLGPTNEAAAQQRVKDEEINRRIQSGDLI